MSGVEVIVRLAIGVTVVLAGVDVTGVVVPSVPGVDVVPLPKVAEMETPGQTQQPQIFVLVNGECDHATDTSGEIIWLTGRRLDDRFKITPETENVLKITREII